MSEKPDRKSLLLLVQHVGNVVNLFYLQEVMFNRKLKESGKSEKQNSDQYLCNKELLLKAFK